jgi:hypothetical protein
VDSTRRELRGEESCRERDRDKDRDSEDEDEKDVWRDRVGEANEGLRGAKLYMAED